MAETWTSYQIFLAVLMVITGSINTLTVKWADQLIANGRNFVHPFLQSLFMFIGEFACLLAYFCTVFVPRPQDSRSTSDDLVLDSSTVAVATEGGVRRLNFNVFIFLPATICDLVATSLMYIGLNFTNAASFQMLRGAVIIFTGLLSVGFLRQQLKCYKWVGMVCVMAGLLVVGLSDIIFMGHGPNVDGNKIISGDLLIIMAQIIVAVQMVYEQSVISKYNVPPLVAVGLEGFFGVICISLLSVPLYYIKVPPPFTNDPESRLDNFLDGFSQMGANSLILVAVIGTTISIAFFNFAGISVTKELNATTRMVMDSVRVMFIWLVSLTLHWQVFVPVQLLGFFLLILGTLIFNDVLLRNFLRSHVIPFFQRHGLWPHQRFFTCCLPEPPQEDENDLLGEPA